MHNYVIKHRELLAFLKIYSTQFPPIHFLWRALAQDVFIDEISQSPILIYVCG